MPTSRLSKAKRAYIEAYCGRFSDTKLARAAGLDKETVRQVARRLQANQSDHGNEAEAVVRDDSPPPYTGLLPAPQWMRPLRKQDAILALVVVAAVLIVYIPMLPPTVTGEDSGELITASYTLGIPHPPGYPVWCLLTHPFTYLPWGSVAWRVALSSAVFAAIACALLSLLTTKLTDSRLAGLVAGLALAFSKEFWEQSLIAEVYALNALFLISCILALILWYQSHRTSYLYALALVYGLSLGNHNTMLLAGPLFVAFILWIDREPWRRWKIYASCTAIAIACLSVYAYLPIRSLANPPVDWGNPENWANFWDVVMRKQYSLGATVNERGVGRFFLQIGEVGRQFGEQFTPWLALLPILGGWALWRRNKFLGTSLIGFGLGIAFVFIVLLNFDLDRTSKWVNGVFFMPLYIVAAVLIGGAVAWIAEKRWRGTRLLPIAGAVAIAAVVMPLSTHRWVNDKSEYFFARDYARNVFLTMEPYAIYLPTADHATFPALYLQAVEGERPDVFIGNKYGYPEKALYEDMPESMKRHFDRIPNEAQDQVIEDWVIMNSERPVYYTKKRAFPKLDGVQLKNDGLLYRVVHADEEWARPDHWEQYGWDALNISQARAELTAEMILSDYHFARGRELLETREKDEGLRHFELGIAAGGSNKETLNNMGSACAEHGFVEEGAKYFERSVTLDPKYELALRNLARAYAALGRHANAYELVDRLVVLGKALPDDVLFGAECLVADGRVDRAVHELLELAKKHPEDAQIYRKLGFIYLEQKGVPDVANQYFATSLSLDPEQYDLASLLRRGQDPPTPPNPLENLAPGPQLPTAPVPTLPR